MGSVKVSEPEKTGDAANAAACIEAGRKIGELTAEKNLPRQIELAGIPHVVKSNETEFESLEQYNPRPCRIVREAGFVDPESFTKYVNEFKDKNSRLYGNVSFESGAASIRAILDDHEAGTAENAPTKNLPRWGQDEATLQLTPSPEWTRWAEKHKKPMAQREFAEFLEESISTIAEPDAAVLDAAVRAFTMRKSTISEASYDGPNVNFSMSENVSGETRLANATMPREMKLVLRPFKISKPYGVRVLIRFRQGEDGMVRFLPCLIEPERVIESAFGDVRKLVEDATGIGVLL